MELTKVFIFLLTLTATTCWTEIIRETSKNEDVSDLVDAMVNIVKLCYANRVNTVGFTRDSSDILIKKLSSQEYLPVTLIDNTTRIMHNRPPSWTSRYPLQLFVVPEYSTTELELILEEIKATLWWNNMAPLFILDMPLLLKNGCANAFEILETAWEMDLLHAKLICHHPTKGILIYGYNPYTGFAPDPWQLEKDYAGRNHHPWTLFVRKYHPNDKQICVELDFDKTNDLGGYKIHATAKIFNNNWSIIPNKTGIDSFGGPSGITAQLLFRALNATPILMLHTSIGNGFSDDRNSTVDITESIIKGISDIAVNIRFQSSVLNKTMTYPFWYGGLLVVTRYNGYAAALSNIQSIVHMKSKYGVYLIILITVMYFKCFLNPTLTPAILNTLRIICNSPLPNVPDNQAPRIYLAALFLFVITIQVIYQGELASVMMKRSPLPNIYTMQDLVDSRHTIYGYKSYTHFFNDPAFKGRFVPQNDLNCIDDVLRESSIACFVYSQFKLNESTHTKLHRSNLLIKMPCVFVIRRNWPLEQRVNKILRALVEADLVWRLDEENRRQSLNDLALRQILKKNEKYKVITLDEIHFVFVILWIGLGCATVSFIIELAVDLVRSKITILQNPIDYFLDWQCPIYL